MYKCVCEECNQGPEDGVAVYRTGEKGPGKNPHWRCSLHIPPKTPVPEEVAVTVALIEGAQSTKH